MSQSPHISWIPGTAPWQSVAESKNAWIYTSSLPYSFTAWCLIKHRDSFVSLKGRRETHILFGKPQGERPPWRDGHRWEDDIKV